MHRRAIVMLFDVDKFSGYFRNRHDEQENQRRGRENANSEVRYEFLHSYLIIALVASKCYFFNCFATKVRCLPLTSALLLLCTLIPRREISVSLVSSPWPSLAFPSFNLIPRLSDRAHEKRIVSRRCPLNFSCRSRLPGVPFSVATRDTASFFVLPSTLPIELQKTTWHLLLVFPPRLPLLDFFYACSIFLLCKLFFATFSWLISLVTRQVTLSAIKTTIRGFSALQ